MAITYPLALPTAIGIADVTFHMVNAKAITQSPFTGKQQVYKWPKQQWEVDIVIPPCKRQDAEQWITFLAKLNAGGSTEFASFYFSDPNASLMGSATGVTSVASTANPNVITLNGITPANANGVFLAGDYIQIGSGASARYHKILDNVDSISGSATAEIWPGNFQEGASLPVSFVNPKGVFMLPDPVASWNINNISSYGIQFKARSII